MELPLWIRDPEFAGMLSVPVERAVAAGLTTRPLAETVADTLAWIRSGEAPDDVPGGSRPRQGAAGAGGLGRESVSRLAGKHAVVTGAGTGIGQAIAVRLAEEGARLTLLARDADRLRDVVDGATVKALRHPRPRPGAGGVRRADRLPRRERRHRRPERRGRRRPLRRHRPDEPLRHLLVCPGRRAPPARRRTHRRHLVDPRPDRGRRLHRLLRVEGGAARPRSLAGRRAGAAPDPGERHLPRLGRTPRWRGPAWTRSRV